MNYDFDVSTGSAARGGTPDVARTNVDYITDVESPKRERKTTFDVRYLF
ncbi:hypothetical protein [Polluticaenibacter yanchengensis]|uniref:TonB-dependent receptor n=1 Tax=Polluticaenibacter yanchengensis TaxID=3014562 RepID=A0ABT4UNK2_9BACT|nr:hypothetical protein [Chitinophagaceae bacterium LY-5]